MSSMIPEQYNTVNITVSPGVLNLTNSGLRDLLLSIADEVNAINTTINNLTMSWWYGSSATLAESYIAEWNYAVQGVFGTQDDPNSGAFGRLADGIASASSNYAATEQWAQKAFSGLVAGLAGSSPSSGEPQEVINPPGEMITAILETF
jgi:hypothetical protein